MSRAFLVSGYTHGGQDVGSVQSLDEFYGYGENFMNPDQFVLDMKDRIHMLGANTTPLLSWVSAVRKNPCHNTTFSWLEDELFTVRDFKAKVVVHTVDSSEKLLALQMLSAQDWQAIEVAAKADTYDANKPIVKIRVSKITATGLPDTTANKFFEVIPRRPCLVYGPTYRQFYSHDGTTPSPTYAINAIALYDTAGSAGEATYGGLYDEVSWVGSGTNNVDETEFLSGAAGSEIDVFVHVYTQDEVLKGFAQGSGLPSETRKRSRTLRGYTQIFKEPYSIANTLKQIQMYGGPELARLRLRKAIQHKTAIEHAILFQGGGVEGTDYGELSSTTENPLTRFQGLGVGITDSTKLGYIKTKHATRDSRFVFDPTTAGIDEINNLCAAIFDDLIDNPSSQKVVFCSNKWLMALSSMANKSDANGSAVFGYFERGPNTLGIVVKQFISPVGTLNFVHMPRLRGGLENWAVVVDLNNIEIRPLQGRDTQLIANAGGRDIDGQLDYYITELGLEVRHESTHAVLRLAS